MYDSESFNLYAMESEGLLSTKRSKIIALAKEIAEKYNKEDEVTIEIKVEGNDFNEKDFNFLIKEIKERS